MRAVSTEISQHERQGGDAGQEQLELESGLILHRLGDGNKEQRRRFHETTAWEQRLDGEKDWRPLITGSLTDSQFGGRLVPLRPPLMKKSPVGSVFL